MSSGAFLLPRPIPYFADHSYLMKYGVYLQAHKLGDRIHDIDLEALDVKVVSEVCYVMLCYKVAL